MFNQKSQISSQIKAKNKVHFDEKQFAKSHLSQNSEPSKILSQNLDFQNNQQNKINISDFRAKRSQIRKRLSLSIPYSDKSLSYFKNSATTCSLKQNQDLSYISSFSNKFITQKNITTQIEVDSNTIKEKQEYFYSQYKILKKIGERLHSCVYKCQKIQTNQLFAVKVSKNIDQELKNRLTKQYKLQKILDNQNVLKVFQLYYHQKEQLLFVVCELCEYKDLRQQMIKKKALNLSFTQKQVSKIFKEILKTIKYLHESGVCHRDIKPENILYNSESGEIKLIDFDISKQKITLKEQFLMWTNTGSLHYRAPQTFAFGYNEKVDIWSLGIVLFQLIFQKLPFNSQYQNQIIKKIKSQPINYPNFPYSKRIEILIKKMLEKDSAKRISSQQALILFQDNKIKPKDDTFIERNNNNKSFNQEKKHYSCQKRMCLSYKVNMNYYNWNIKTFKSDPLIK